MKNRFIITLIAACALAPAQEFIKATEYNFSAHQFTPVLGVKVQPVEKLFGNSKIKAELWGLVSVLDQKVNLGSAVVVPYEIARGWKVYAGIGLWSGQDKKLAAGPVFGVQIDLK